MIPRGPVAIVSVPWSIYEIEQNLLQENVVAAFLRTGRLLLVDSLLTGIQYNCENITNTGLAY